MNKAKTAKRYRRLLCTGYLGFGENTTNLKDDAVRILRTFPEQSDEFDERVLRAGGFYEDEDT